MAGATWNCCLLGASCVHHTTMHHDTTCEATYVRCVRILAVTCHLHFWQNDQDLLRAAAVTGGGTDTETSQHRKLTLEKKILPPPLQRLEPTTFRSRVLGRFSLYMEIQQSHMAQDPSSRKGVAKFEGFPSKDTLVYQILHV